MEVDAFLADSVASAEGKLYAQGAGWNAVLCPQFPARHARLGVGVLIHVPYTATNQLHTFELHIEDEDGHTIALGDAVPGNPQEPGDEDGKVRRIKAQFNVGRPPILHAGDEQIVPIALNVDGLMFEQPGSYSVVITIDATVLKRLSVRLNVAPFPVGMIR